ncbi:MAG TPA: PQQ-binding-like beta-propeller repeat protein [Planctomycetota bacterium]|nr:PQQ-binding-like beta-propeller repeat protein [Planctomycetota bacterium]
MKHAFLGLAVSFALAGAARGGENWPQWRGPSLDGTSDSTGLPLKWSETENVKWKVKLPSWSGATPVIWGDRMFVPSAGGIVDGAEANNLKGLKKEGKDLLLLCLSKKDGKELWRTQVAGANYQVMRQNMSSPSAVTDGTMVWWNTGTGVLTALTVEGKQLWQEDLQTKWGKFGLNHGYGASPLLYEGMVIVPVLHGMKTDDPSYLVAFEGKTGKVVWRVERPTDAKNESPDAYTTPMLMKVGDRTEMVVVGGDYFTGHDPKTGRELWRCGGLNPKQDPWFRAVCSPAIVGDMAFARIKQGPLVGCRGGGKGDVTSTHTLWTTKDGCDVPTAVSDGVLLYVLHDGGLMSCFEPATGKVLYEKQRLPQGTYWSSPLLADGRIYVTNHGGRTTVIAQGPEFKVLSENPLDDTYTLSSIAVSGKELFIRTSTSLYCIAAK